MPAMNVNDILNAYRSTVQNSEGNALPGVNKVGGQEFGDLLKGVMSHTVDQLKAADKVSLAAVNGKASINDVVSAVSSAEVALQTVVAIRDKVIGAYQDLMRSGI